MPKQKTHSTAKKKFKVSARASCCAGARCREAHAQVAEAEAPVQ
jgi:ribosomal protein L35